MWTFELILGILYLMILIMHPICKTGLNNPNNINIVGFSTIFVLFYILISGFIKSRK